ncbi:hypothetical protein PYH37_004440 [Sinorhizobium numidicum]|uniref:Uncharacterized protein n=1 Tax=Sinorhizobium numidicum TaxID=680248 RepID=A0ABY8CW07_9HYPH|nr:hypothetical protein [Sinorhizobium numidicum]WEX76162.1 hypothetical protein PYH37_004440 [Sinorhizobium numidicum]WEX82821.1 hypothetical protein PYH38_005152 [Sinorhizobium numidicum]
MRSLSGLRDYPILMPDDIELLQSVFDRELRVRNLKCNSEEAELLAMRLIELYQAGVKQPEALRNRIDGS